MYKPENVTVNSTESFFQNDEGDAEVFVLLSALLLNQSCN